MIKQTKLSERLYKLRTEKRIPSQDVAKILGVAPPMYSKMERGNRNIKLDYLPILASLYQIECKELQSLWIVDKITELMQMFSKEAVDSALSIVTNERGDDNEE
ncbi:helix-turn-helix domain-containing protein [Capnocytophaga canimorsus]|uniref:helix-turn-helix domain-containing protein n=1 Tax=Capnocytophaga canimorsus TaxID=28188 RepID=UPI0037D83B04